TQSSKPASPHPTIGLRVLCQSGSRLAPIQASSPRSGSRTNAHAQPGSAGGSEARAQQRADRRHGEDGSRGVTDSPRRSSPRERSKKSGHDLCISWLRWSVPGTGVVVGSALVAFVSDGGVEDAAEHGDCERTAELVRDVVPLSRTVSAQVCNTEAAGAETR